MGGMLLWQLSWSLALLFLGFSLGIFAAWIGAKRSGTGESMKDILSLTAEHIRLTATRIAANITAMMLISFLLFGAICWSHGYYYRGDKENRVRYTYTDVMVIARHSDRSFTLQPARMRPWDTDDMCDPEDWQPNQKLISMTYSVRQLASGETCKDVERGGEWYRYMRDGKPIEFQQETLTDARY